MSNLTKVFLVSGKGVIERHNGVHWFL